MKNNNSKSKLLAFWPEVSIDWRVYTKNPNKPLIRDLIIEGLSLAELREKSLTLL